MPNQTQAALSRNWAILIALILQIRGQVALLTDLNDDRRNQIFQLLRLAESLARRWLILNARFRGVGRVAGKSPANIPRGEAPGAASGPLLRLEEANPVLRPEDYSLRPFEPEPPRDADAMAIDAAPAGLRSTVAITHRARALLDIVKRPAHHTARMARWLRRAAAQTGFGRLHPLRVGRPPGARRRQKTCKRQAALWWLDQLARDSLQPGWEP